MKPTITPQVSGRSTLIDVRSRRISLDANSSMFRELHPREGGVVRRGGGGLNAPAAIAAARCKCSHYRNKDAIFQPGRDEYQS